MSAKSKTAPIDLTPNKTPLTLEVVPHVGLKNEKLMFLLGMPLNQIITMCQQNAGLIGKIQLKYSKKDVFGCSVCLYLSSDGIKLYFDGPTQLLKLIEVDNLSRISLSYGNVIFSEPFAQTSLDKLNNVFGSTHPGAYDEKQKMYVQSWPGLSFCFPTDSNGTNDAIRLEPGFGPNMLSLKYDASCQPRLTKMSIYQGTDLSRPESVDIPFSCFCGQNRTRLIEAIWENGDLIGLHITFDTQTGSLIDGDLEVYSVEKKIYFGDPVSVVQTALGAPSKVYYKSEDKMKIHRGSTKETLIGLPHFFFNYFSMGLVSAHLMLLVA
ncbi:unnamed protein product [Caenorhabditis bovis]|uniref:Uncharacterized protein n=1 Tax=Caenorhabditis bovis TaxID=2654633 RepID=A0A8S1FAV7_9PELO|nr:unnamed protein product [Caenorhabditis bovis]